MIREDLIENVKQKLLKYRKLVLYGDSGVGKSYIAHHIANTLLWHKILVVDELHRRMPRAARYVIGTTTTEVWNQKALHFKSHGYHGYQILETTREETISILYKLKPYFEVLRGIKLSDLDIQFLYITAEKRMNTRAFPARAVDLMDMVSARRALKNGVIRFRNSKSKSRTR